MISGVKTFHTGDILHLCQTKPLLAILASKKCLPTLAAAHLQRWAIFLLGYQHDLQFRPTSQHCNADGLSHLPRNLDSHEGNGATSCKQLQIDVLSLSHMELKTASSMDPIHSKLLRYSQEAWPSELTETLKLYLKIRTEFSTEGGSLFLESWVIILVKCQPKVLAELFMGLQGIVKMKGLA